VVLVSVGAVVGASETGGGPSLAVVAEVHGEVVLRPAAGAARDLELFDRLGAGDRLETGPSASVVVAFWSGERLRVGAGSMATVRAEAALDVAGTVEPLPPVSTAPALVALARGQAPGPRSGAIRVRSAGLWGEAVEDLYPRDGLATPANAAVLTFSPLVSSDSYRLEVEDELGETVFAAETRSPEVVVPAGVLLPGTEYYWRVRSAGRRSLAGHGEALFVTLSAEDAAAREALRREVEAEGSAHALLLLAEVDRNLGLLREACTTLDRVAAMGGDTAHLGPTREVFACDQYGRN
jgi:hypothetical protein